MPPYTSHAARYKEVAVYSASPSQLVVITYDHLLRQLQRVRIALEERNVEQRCTALGRTREALGELLSALDSERGGPLAQDLSALYTFCIAELVGVRDARDLPRVNRLANMLQELRDAFAVAGTQLRAGAA